jgi:hypothetical protein
MRYQYRIVVTGIGAQGSEFRFVPVGTLSRRYREEAAADAANWNSNRRYSEGIASIERQLVSDWEPDEQRCHDGDGSSCISEVLPCGGNTDGLHETKFGTSAISGGDESERN